LFIQENLSDRAVQADKTNEFLDLQLEEAKRQLLQQESRLADYQRRYAGELPSQAQVNLQVIQSAQAQLQALSESINRDRDQRLILERQLADLDVPEAIAAVVPAAPLPANGNATDPQPGLPTAQLVEQARAQLAAMELRYKPDHPDVQGARRVLRDLEAKLQAELRARPAPVPPEPPKPQTPAEVLRERRRQELQAQLQNFDRQLARKHAQEEQLQQTIADTQAKVDAVPTRQAELTELTRDYSTLQQTYTNLLAKREDSKMAANLERNQVGEQFKVLDPARIPERPYSPDLLRLNAVGVMGGLMIGLVFAGLLEYRDGTFRSEDDIVRVLNLPVLAQVPVVNSPGERRWRRRQQIAAVAGILFVIVGSAYAVLWSLGRV
jgi:polysaccharide chain length determinant protein (PEP-CTERM system associated)